MPQTTSYCYLSIATFHSVHGAHYSLDITLSFELDIGTYSLSPSILKEMMEYKPLIAGTRADMINCLFFYRPQIDLP